MRRIALFASALVLTGAAAAGEAEDRGKTIFAKCGICHAVGPDAKNKIGPVLNGIVGRAPASTEYAYSQAMQDFAAANPAWTEDLLSQYVENPKALVPGGKMAFAGLKKPEDRADLIAFLKTNP